MVLTIDTIHEVGLLQINCLISHTLSEMPHCWTLQLLLCYSIYLLLPRLCQQLQPREVERLFALKTARKLVFVTHLKNKWQTIGLILQRSVLYKHNKMFACVYVCWLCSDMEIFGNNTRWQGVLFKKIFLVWVTKAMAYFSFLFWVKMDKKGIWETRGKETKNVRNKIKERRGHCMNIRNKLIPLIFKGYFL